MIYDVTPMQRFGARHCLRDPRTNDPITLGILASSALSTGVAFFAGELFFGSIVAHFLITTALGLALNLLTPKPSAGSDGGHTINGTGGAQPQGIIYGRTVVGGPRTYDETTDGNKYLHRIISLAGHECDAVETVYFDDEELTLDGSGEITAPSKWVGKARVKIHLGDQTTADADLVAESDGLWLGDHIGFEICYLYCRFLFDRDAFPRGVPKITAKVRGKKLFDPRTSTTVWTDNAALCFRDYLRADYGMNASIDKVDDVNYIIAADTCDETVALAVGGTESRYTVNGSFTTNVAPRGIMSGMHAAMAGFPAYGQGEWKSFPGVFTSATKTLTEDDLRSDINVSPRHARAANFNSVRGLFKGEETNWIETDFPPIESSVFLAEDNGRDNVADLNLPFTTTSTMAQRISKISLYRNREQITVTASFGLNAFDVEIGEVVQLTYDVFGWAAKEFECVSWKFNISEKGEPLISLILREISSGVFDWNADEAAFIANNTNLPNAFITAEAGTAISNELRSINEKVMGVLIVDVTSSEAGFVAQFEVQARKSSDADWTNLGIASGKRFELLDVSDVLHDVRARTINSFGVRGDWNQTDDYLVTAFADPPSDVSNFDINVLNGMAHLTWDAVSDLDLSYYIIRHAPVITGGVYSAAVTVAPKVSRPATSIALPYREGTYFIRAIDKVGNESVTPSSISTNIATVEGLNAIQTVTESTTFLGGRSDLTLDTGTLKITDTSLAPSSGTYDFATVVDLTDKFTSRCQAHVEFIRDDATGDLFDAATGLFDSRAGMFDGGEFTDVNVVMQVSLTDDDPTMPEDALSGSVFHDLDAFLTADRDLGADAFTLVDLTFDATPTGTIVENGGANSGFYVGFVASGDFVARAGDGGSGHPSQAALVTISAATFAGKSGRLYIGTIDATSTISVWWWEDGTTSLTLLATDTAVTNWTNWTGSADGAFGNSDGAFAGSDGGGNFNGTLKRAVHYRSTTPPTMPTTVADWSAYKDFTVGDFSARGLRFRSVLSSTSDDVGPKINTLKVDVDMPDRVIAEADVVSGAGAKTVTYSPAFKAEPGLGISAQGLATGDYYLLTSKTATGFTIHFKNSADASISRTFDYVARGYGKVI